MAKLVPQSHSALHTISEEVPAREITSVRIQKVLKDMRSALRSYKDGEFTGVAIAAPQIGIPLRMFLIEEPHDKEKKKKRDVQPLPSLVAINPRIIKFSKEKKLMSEGCLSVSGRYGRVYRFLRARMQAYDERGRRYERGASNLLAQIFQHEVDHLDGILFLDRAEEIIGKEIVSEKKSVHIKLKPRARAL